MSWLSDRIGSDPVGGYLKEGQKFFFGQDSSDFMNADKYRNQWGNTFYQPYKEYNPFNFQTWGGGMGQAFENANNQYLTGQLSPAALQNQQNIFTRNMAATREGAYGMPIGAQKQLEASTASENALQTALLGEQMRGMGMQNYLNYAGMGQRENQFGYSQGLQQHQFGQQFNQQERQYQSQLDAQAEKMAAESPGMVGYLLQGLGRGAGAAMGGMF